jgi:uncharacterized membrane protein
MAGRTGSGFARAAAAASLALALAACADEPQSADPEHGAGPAPPPQQANAAPANQAAPTPPPPATPSQPMSPTGYALVGSQPPWGGTVTGTRIRYMTPERQFGDVVETRRSYAPGAEIYSGSFRGRPFVLTLRAAPCSDGASDIRYTFTATLEVLGTIRRGLRRSGAADQLKWGPGSSIAQRPSCHRA